MSNARIQKEWVTSPDSEKPALPRKRTPVKLHLAFIDDQPLNHSVWQRQIRGQIKMLAQTVEFKTVAIELVLRVYSSGSDAFRHEDFYPENINQHDAIFLDNHLPVAKAAGAGAAAVDKWDLGGKLAAEIRKRRYERLLILHSADHDVEQRYNAAGFATLMEQIDLIIPKPMDVVKTAPFLLRELVQEALQQTPGALARTHIRDHFQKHLYLPKRVSPKRTLQPTPKTPSATERFLEQIKHSPDLKEAVRKLTPTSKPRTLSACFLRDGSLAGGSPAGGSPAGSPPRLALPPPMALSQSLKELCLFKPPSPRAVGALQEDVASANVAAAPYLLWNKGPSSP